MPTEPNSAIAARHERIASLGFLYTDQPVQAVTCCNLCGEQQFVVVTHKDRYGFRAAAHACRRCGLIFLNPVMTPDAYKAFYASVYRPLVSAYHGRLIDARTIQAEQRDYAVARGDFLAPFIAKVGFSTLLDIGGSTGVVASALCSRFTLKGTVIDPSPPEIKKARQLGLEAVVGLIEEYDPGIRQFDVVVMCQTVDHLLDIFGTLRAVRDLISPSGVFFLDIVDFRAAYLRESSVEGAVKIDHPYYLTQATVEAYLKRTGFDVIRMDFAEDHLHVGYACRPGVRDSTAMPPHEATRGLFEEIRYVQNAPRPA